MIRALGTACLVFAALAARASSASADTLKLFAEIDGGGLVGQGTTGDRVIKDSAFFAKAPHLAYGGLIGAELLFLDVMVQHHQFTDGDRIATWSQLGLAAHFQFDFGEPEQQKAHEGGFFEIAGGGWVGLGTGQQVRPPLDNAQVTDKAVLVEARAGVGTHLSSVFDLGVQVPVSWGLFFKNGNGAAINNASTHYQGIQAEGLVFLRANLRLL
ncbi:MAG TPA: hypothetical protein VFP84_34270 [Kofleriaceae bacterium]|nr:hypothetical protein [Kofleriaceae bacterium]